MIDPGWILLENHPPEDVFGNPLLVQNIFHSGRRYIMIHCYAGKRRVTKVDTLKGYGTVCIVEGAISNILSFVIIKET